MLNMDQELLLVCFDINSSHEENISKKNDKSAEELIENPIRIFNEYFDNHKKLKMEKNQLNNSEIKYNFDLGLPECSQFQLIVINDLSFVHDICLNADGYLIVINLEDIKTEEKLEYIIKYISDGCCNLETKSFIVGLYKDKILPGYSKETLETLFNDHNLIYEYHQIKYSLGAKNHNCFFDIINNKGNKKNINQNDYKSGFRLQEILEKIIVNMYETKMGVEYDPEKKKYVKALDRGNEANSKCEIY